MTVQGSGLTAADSTNGTVLKTVDRLPASSERVFDAWTKARLLARFFFPPEAMGGGVNRAVLDARVGGQIEVDHVRQGRLYVFRGEYLELERPRRIVYKISESGQSHGVMSLELADDDEGAVLTATQIMPEGASLPERDARWEAMIGRLVTLLRNSAGREFAPLHAVG